MNKTLLSYLLLITPIALTSAPTLAKTSNAYTSSTSGSDGVGGEGTGLHGLHDEASENPKNQAGVSGVASCEKQCEEMKKQASNQCDSISAKRHSEVESQQYQESGSER